MANRDLDMDHLALQILQRLLLDSRKAYSKIAKELGVATSTVSRQVAIMLQNGTISRFTCNLNHTRLYEGTIVFAKIKVQQELDSKDLVERMSALMEILEVYSITDSGDYLIKVIVPSNAGYGEFINDVVRNILGFQHIDSIIVLNQLLRRDPEPQRAFPVGDQNVNGRSRAFRNERKRQSRGQVRRRKRSKHLASR